MDRIGADVNTLTFRSYRDHDKVVNVVQIIADNLFSMSRTSVAYDKVSGCTNCYFIGDWSMVSKRLGNIL
jgi:hypothetical protein